MRKADRQYALYKCDDGNGKYISTSINGLVYAIRVVVPV